ncbi:MAG: dual specificity protein phosphatase family protein, partial [Planctomycetota bacterium]
MIRKIKNKSHRQTLTIGAISLAVGLSIWCWEEVLEDRLIPKRWGAIEAGAIYRSGRLSGTLVEKTLKKYQIKTIVSLTGETPAEQTQKTAAKKLGIEVKRFPLRGNGTGDFVHYAEAIMAMVKARNQGKPVLVHCASGAQRTGGVTACYRLLIENQTPEFVYKEMQRYDWKPHRNPVLVDYINQNLPAIAAYLKNKGIIEKIQDPLPKLPFLTSTLRHLVNTAGRRAFVAQCPFSAKHAAPSGHLAI